MDVPTARRNLKSAQTALKSAQDRFNELAAEAARTRRPHPDLEQAKTDRRAAEVNMRRAMDDHRKAQERPRYTAPR